ncbi:MAG: restriction endonuclease subunit S, partial [Bacteroidales bacterium]|nr:restriction endonuclease subunit S [Bacteroidales bacterium]
ELFVLRPNERVDLRYLFYVSISKAFRQTGSNMMQGAAGQKRITADFVNNYPVALPRPEEQRSIASSLEKATEKMDSFISKIEKSIELLKEYRSALITAAVTGKIDVREEVP